MHAESLAGGSLVGESLARKTEKGTKHTLIARIAVQEPRGRALEQLQETSYLGLTS
jgi:hypothetical protein